MNEVLVANLVRGGQLLPPRKTANFGERLREVGAAK